MSFSETIFLFFLALVIFGPKKLPEIARQVGKALNEFKRASNEFRAQIEQEIAHLEVENKPTILPPAEPPAGATSRNRYGATELEGHAEVPALAGATGDVQSTALAAETAEPASAADLVPASPPGTNPAPNPADDVTASDPAFAAPAQSGPSVSPTQLSSVPESHA